MQPNLDLMMEKLNMAAVETKAFKAQGDNRAAKDEDRKLRDNIANATHNGNGKLVASRKLWSVRRARTKARKAAQMIAWSSGVSGWKMNSE